MHTPTTQALAGSPLKLALAAALSLSLTACAHKAEKAASAPEPAASAAPAAAASAAPAAAEEAKAAEGPYLHTLLEDAAQKRAWQRMSAKAPGWVRKAQGPAVPAVQVTVDGRDYWQGSVCQQHNCPNTFFYLLPVAGDRAYGVHGNFGQSAGRLKRLKPVFHGAPPKAERAALQALFEEERKRQLGEHTR